MFGVRNAAAARSQQKFLIKTVQLSRRDLNFSSKIWPAPKKYIWLGVKYLDGLQLVTNSITIFLSFSEQIRRRDMLFFSSLALQTRELVTLALFFSPLSLQTKKRVMVTVFFSSLSLYRHERVTLMLFFSFSLKLWKRVMLMLFFSSLSLQTRKRVTLTLFFSFYLQIWKRATRSWRK